MTSEFRTKNGLSSLRRISSASLRGPAVPNGSVSIEKVILMPNCCSYYVPEWNRTGQPCDPRFLEVS